MLRQRSIVAIVLAAAVVALVPLIAGCTAEALPPSGKPAGIEVSDAWVRATTDSTDESMTGAFMALTNRGDSAVRLVGATSSVAAEIQIHTMVMENGTMVMQEVQGGLEVRAGSHTSLRPGGEHLMLMGLPQPFAAGDEVTLTLEFSDGTRQELTVPVKEFTEEEDHYHPSPPPTPKR